ncbi:flavin reductase [Pelomyxa schiedti]|nr:flavin reductase [Pelomyxa schiedti]
MDANKVSVEPFQVMASLCTTTVIVGAVLPNGKPNFMAIAWCCPASHQPPSLLICSARRHLTNSAILANKAFSISIPSRALVEKLDFAGIKSGSATDKSTLFQTFECPLKGAPLLKECPVTIACSLSKHFEMEAHEIFVGKIEHVYANSSITTNGAVDALKMDPCLFSFSGPSYFQLGPKFAIPWSVGGGYNPASATTTTSASAARPFPHVDTSVCVGCGACAGSCVANPTLWTMDAEGHATFAVERVNDCVRCGHCVEGCPVSAISMKL